MSTTAAQRIAVTAAREALAEVPDYRDNTEPLYWVGRLKAAVELLLGAYAPDVPWEQLPDLTVRPAFVPGFQPAAPVPDVCRDCGADDGLVPFIGGGHRCYNAERCAERAAARDAEAAQAVTR